jgi:hypothetical protein
VEQEISFVSSAIADSVLDGLSSCHLNKFSQEEME